jgi:hypothetical protein
MYGMGECTSKAVHNRRQSPAALSNQQRQWWQLLSARSRTWLGSCIPKLVVHDLTQVVIQQQLLAARLTLSTSS